MNEIEPRHQARPDLGRITLSVLFIGGLIAGSLWILSPFLGAFIWATMIVVATWPMMRRVERAFGGHRAPAVAVMSIGLLAILIVPLGVALQAILDHTDELVALLERLPETKFPAPPEWLDRVPLAGERLEAAWTNLASEGLADLMVQAQPHLRAVATWLAQHAGGFALLLVQFVLIVILSAVLYTGGESWAGWMRGFARKLADERGDRMVVLAGQAIRGVALGVVVTALVQSVLGGIGLVIAGVPFAGVLTAIMFALCIAQLGPIIVLGRGDRLGLHQPWYRLGHLLAGVDAGGWHPGQFPAPGTDPSRSRPAAAAHFRRRHRWTRCVRCRRHIRRTSRTGGRIHTARRLGRDRRSGQRGSA